VTTGAGDYISEHTAPVLDSARIAETCLVVVDMMYATGHPETGLGRLLEEQGRLEQAAYRFGRIAERVLPNTLALLEFARLRGMRRVFVTYGSEVSDYSDLGPELRGICEATGNRVGRREHELLDELAVRPDERVVNKLTMSAFTSTPLELILHTYGSRTLLFCGVSTDMCVEASMRDAADRGFRCVLVEDACGADLPAAHDAACRVLGRLYGEVRTTSEVLERLAAACA
jgi:biuret amidohydrolase